MEVYFVILCYYAYYISISEAVLYTHKRSRILECGDRPLGCHAIYTHALKCNYDQNINI